MGDASPKGCQSSACATRIRTAEEPSDENRQHDQLHGKAGAGRQQFRRDAHHEHDNREGDDAKLRKHA